MTLYTSGFTQVGIHKGVTFGIYKRTQKLMVARYRTVVSGT